MVSTNRQEINLDHAHTHKQQSIWILRRNRRDRRNNQDWAVRRTGQSRCQNTAHGPLQSIRRDNQDASLGNTIQGRATHRNDKTHQKRTTRNKTSTEIQMGVWRTNREQYCSISRIVHQRAAIHNIYGRRDGWQRRTELTIKSPNQDSARQTARTSKTTTMGTNKRTR